MVEKPESVNKKLTNKTIKKSSNKKSSNKKSSNKKLSNKKSSNKKSSNKKSSNKTVNKINRNLSRVDIKANPNLLPKYMPDVITVPVIEKSIFDYSADIKFSVVIDYPKFSLGFQHYIHAMKNDTDILKKFENKKKSYQVLNPFERYIDNYNQSIGSLSKAYFDIENDKPDILSRGFYKLWEMFFMFDLIQITDTNFTSAHLAEGPGSFIQATMFYRDLFAKKETSKNDKYYAITIHPEDVDGHIPELEQKFIDYYDKESPKRFFQHKTYGKEQIGGHKDNGDLMNPLTLNNFCGSMIGGNKDSTIKEKIDFITADGGFEWVNENIQEQEYYKLLFSQIVTAINIQKKGGSFVCKFFETFTDISMKFITIISSLYDRVYFCKPLTSRSSNSEKYIVAQGFKYSDSDSKLKDIIRIMNELHKQIYLNLKLKIYDIFSEYKIIDELKIRMTMYNDLILNKQFKAIGQILTFVDAENYYGDTYQKAREEQIEAAKYWTELFFMPQSEFKQNKAKINDISYLSNKINLEESLGLRKKLIF